MKILLPVDGSTCSENALQWAVQSLNPDNAKFHLLQVIPVLPDLNTMEYDIAQSSKMLNGTREQMKEMGCTDVQVDYVLGDAAQEICRYAENKGMDLVVMGSHGRTGLAKLLMGSVSVAVLEHCKRPVIIYRCAEIQAAKKHEPALSNTILSV